MLSWKKYMFQINYLKKMMNEEQKIIKKYFSPIAKNKESLGLINDAAIIYKKKLVVSTDMMIENQHFDKSYDPKYLAKKLLRVNLSDIAAMGAEPYGYTLNISLPKTKHISWIQRFVIGLREDNKRFKLKLFGGDISRSSKIFLSATIFGVIRKKVHDNSLAKEGSQIYVSGFLGDAALGLEIQKKKKINDLINNSTKEYFLKKLYLPEPQIELGRSLLGLADFCTDISDGLEVELSRVCENSNLQANIYLSKVPVSNKAKKVFKVLKSKKNDIWDRVLFGGEDYKLLFSVRKEKEGLLIKKIKNIHKIGFFKKGKGIYFLDEKNKKKNFKNKSFNHF